MLESLGTLLLGIVIGAVASAGLLVWFDRRKDDAAVEDAADQQKAGGGGGPKPVK